MSPNWREIRPGEEPTDPDDPWYRPPQRHNAVIAQMDMTAGKITRVTVTSTDDDPEWVTVERNGETVWVGRNGEEIVTPPGGEPGDEFSMGWNGS